MFSISLSEKIFFLENLAKYSVFPLVPFIGETVKFSRRSFNIFEEKDSSRDEKCLYYNDSTVRIYRRKDMCCGR